MLLVDSMSIHTSCLFFYAFPSLQMLYHGTRVDIDAIVPRAKLAIGFMSCSSKATIPQMCGNEKTDQQLRSKDGNLQFRTKC